ncbi:MAG TPA: hypothetical protein VE198_19595 [Actinoallomurus sp.]|nr:hypothetical protein [Actinoallomurus sp.]
MAETEPPGLTAAEDGDAATEKSFAGVPPPPPPVNGSNVWLKYQVS